LLHDFGSLVNSVRASGKSSTALALAQLHMGDLQREMGDWPGANDSLAAAERLLNAQVIKEPKRFDHRRDLANCRNLLGVVERQQGHIESATKLGEQAVATLGELFADNPDEITLPYDYAKAANSLAMLWIHTGEKQRAADLLELAKHQLDTAISQWPEEIPLQEISVFVCSNLASALSESNPNRAVELCRQAVDLQTKICRVNNQARPSADLAVAYSNLGRALARAQQLESARDAYLKANEISELVCQLAPNNSDYRRQKAINLNNLGMVEQRTGDQAAARKYFDLAIADSLLLCEAYPANASLRHELGGTYNNLANLLEKSGQISEVDQNYQLAIENQWAAHKAAPSVAVYREFLDTHYHNYVRWLTETGRYDAALGASQDRQKVWDSNDPHQMAIARQLADAAIALAADKRKQSQAILFGQAANHVLEVAEQAGLSVQSYYQQDSYSSLAKLKWLMESARP
jgi:tetratricopeptide (TPR) repeat protein